MGGTNGCGHQWMWHPGMESTKGWRTRRVMSHGPALHHTAPHRTAQPRPGAARQPREDPASGRSRTHAPSPTAQAAVSHRSVFRSRSAAATLGEGGSGGGRGAARGPEAARGDRKRRAAWRGCRCATRPWTAPCARFSVRAARRGAAAGRAARVAALRLPALRSAG